MSQDLHRGHSVPGPLVLPVGEIPTPTRGQPPHRESSLGSEEVTIKPGGWIFASTVSRFASLIDGLSRDLASDPAFVSILREDLQSGQHRNPTNSPAYFTTTFFHQFR